MIDITTRENSNVVYTIATEKIHKEDVDKLFHVIEQLIKSHGKARWYYEMHDFNGWDFDAFWIDLFNSFKHTNDFEKIAMVGEARWQDWMTQVMKPFTSASIQYFDMADKQKAKDWIIQ